MNFSQVKKIPNKVKYKKKKIDIVIANTFF